MAIRPEYEKAYSTFIVMGIFVLAVNIYYYAYPLWDSMGMTHPIAVKMFLKMRRAGYFASPLYTKGLALVLSLLTVMTRHGRRNSLPWWRISIVAVSGVFLYFFPFGNPAVYTAASAVGYLTVILGASLSLYKLTGFIKKRNDFKETFLQCEKKIDTEFSVNLQTRYQYKGKQHTGWINVVNPFRGTMVLGTPGSGKSFSVYLPFMEQMIRKGYTMFVYDYKYPSLTFDVYNMLLQNIEYYDRLGQKRPMFCVVNFKDPRYSLRCNPLNPQYITSLTDCTEIADVIMKNLVETDKKDFFTQSAQLYIDCCTSFLWVYEKGRYCSFPHLVELMCHRRSMSLDSYRSIQSFRRKWRPSRRPCRRRPTSSSPDRPVLPRFPSQECPRRPSTGSSPETISNWISITRTSQRLYASAMIQIIRRHTEQHLLSSSQGSSNWSIIRAN